MLSLRVQDFERRRRTAQHLVQWRQVFVLRHPHKLLSRFRKGSETPIGHTGLMARDDIIFCQSHDPRVLDSRPRFESGNVLGELRPTITTYL